MAWASEVKYRLPSGLHDGGSAMEALVQIVCFAAAEQPDFLERLRGLSRSRPLVGRSRDEVFPSGNRQRNHTREILPGWYIRTDLDNAQKVREAKRVAEAAGFEYGREVELIISR